ncbi:MAG: hypothetical protein ACLTS6_10010 [Anaerobutyricum sp.]
MKLGKADAAKSTLLNLIAGPGKTDRRKNSFKWKRSESTRFGTDSDVFREHALVSMAECNSKYKVWNGDKRSARCCSGNKPSYV